VLLSEDFANALPDDWISQVVAGNDEPSAAWIHTTVGPTGPVGGEALNSPTATNGWMIFDSDLNCNNQMAQDAWLISPPIPAGEATEVFLSFATYYWSFNDRPQLRIGSDLEDLASWVTIEVFPGVEANDYGGPDPTGVLNPVLMRFDLSEWLAGSNEQRIAFQFLADATTINGGDEDFIACAYFWQIDDVELTTEDPRPNFEMAINPFAAIAPNAMTPLCQLEPLHFLADVANNGRATPDSTILNLTIRNNTNEIVFTDRVRYGPIAPDSVAENVFFAQAFLPPMEPMLYTGLYRLEYPGMEEDALPSNNELTFFFRVTDDEFAKELGATRSIAPADGPSYIYGNVFYVVEGLNKVIEEVSFAVNNAEELSGRNVTVFVAEWDGQHADSRFVSPEEYSIVGFTDYTFTGSEGNSRIGVAVRSILDEAIVLKDSTYYIVAVDYLSTDQVPLELLASEDFDYFATVFQTDSLEMPRYSSVLNVRSVDAQGELDLLGFGYDVVPTIRMKIEDCESVSTKDLPLSTELVRVYPNPVGKQLRVHLAATKAEMTSLRLYNLQGQLLQERTISAAEPSTMSLDLGHLAAGSYLLDVRGAGTRQTILIAKQ